MTTSADSDTEEIEIAYEGPSITFGGYDAATFLLSRPRQPALELDLRLALDARELFEAKASALSDESVQALLRALASHLYRERLAEGQEIPAILTVRASHIDPAVIDDILAEAGLR